MEKTRIYPLGRKDNPPEMVFPNGSGQPANMLYPQDYSYFEGLAEFVEQRVCRAGGLVHAWDDGIPGDRQGQPVRTRRSHERDSEPREPMSA